MTQASKENFEQSNITGKNQEGFKANTPVRVLTASSIIGDAVESRDGDEIATVKDIMLNLQDGTIEYVILSAGGFLGIGNKLFAIPFHELHLNTSNHSFIINRDKEYIKNAPGFDQNHWPETNKDDDYDNVNDYWQSTTSPYSSGDTITGDYNGGTRVGTSGIVDPTDQSTFR